MGLRLFPEQHKSVEGSGPSAPCVLRPIDLKVTHVDCCRDTTLVHFQGQQLNVCELDYSILQVEIQDRGKTPQVLAQVEVGDLCLVEDEVSARWFRGQVQNRRRPDLYDVFLIDYGNVLSVDASRLSSCSDDVFRLPPKIFCGFFSNVLPGRERWDEGAEKYFSSLIGSQVRGFIQAVLPHKVLILEVPHVNRDLSTAGLGKHSDTDTFLLLVEMLTGVPLKQSTEPVLDLLAGKPSGRESPFQPSSLRGFENILQFCGSDVTAGKRATVAVTAAVSPGTFYCQPTSAAAELSAMSLRLAATCASKGQGSLQKSAGNLGLLCSVKGKDGVWCRGFVQSLPVDSQVRVLFVDYGYCEPVDVENMHRLPSDLLFTPIMAFPCSLACLNEQDEAVKTEQLDFLKRGLLGEVLHLEINGFNKEQNLYSVTLLSAERNIVAKEKKSHHIPEQKRMEILCDNEEVLPPGGQHYYETTVIQAFNHSIQTKEIGPVFEGYIEHIINPNHFYIRTQKRNRHFEELMNKMAAHFSTVTLEENIVVNPGLGTLCCAMYEKDMHYYRAIVTAVLEHGAEVFFIDFGNVEKVPHMLIKKIPEEFVSEPAFALSCSQVDVLPIGDCWTSANTEWFRQATHQKVLLVRVVHLQKAKCIVDLYEAGKKPLQSISEVMTSEKQAEFWRYTPSMPVVVRGNAAKKHKKLNGPKKGPRGAPHIMAAGQVGNVQLQTTKEQIRTTIRNGFEIPKEKTATRQTVPVKMAAGAAFSPVTFEPGCEFAVSVSHVDSPADFWCQLPSSAPSFDKLMDDLQRFYGAHSIAITTGASCCVARSPGDGRWSRACITGELADGRLKVILVDFGVTIRADVGELQEILPEYLELEGQSIRCSLYNLVEPLASGTGQWSAEACRSFKDFVLDNKGSLKCCVVSQLFVRDKGLCNVVDLVGGDTRRSACRRLVELGLVREVTRPTQLHPSALAESFVFSSFGLSEGCREQAYVTHVDRPEEMYLQLERNGPVMEELSAKAAAWSKKVLQAKSGATAGKLCLAKYHDGIWYRARNLRGQSPLHLSVFFVDYGNAYTVEKSNAMPLPRGLVDLLFTPMQALRCSLARVRAEENHAEVSRWLEKTVLNKPVRVEVVGKSEAGTFIVELYHGDVHVNERVNELIASLTPKVSRKRKELLACQSPKWKGVELVTNQFPAGKERVANQSTGKKLAANLTPKVKISECGSKKKQLSFREQKTRQYRRQCQNFDRQSSLLLSSSSSSRSSSRSNGSTHSDRPESNTKAQREDISSVETEGNKSGQSVKRNHAEAPLQRPQISFETPTKLSNLPDNKVKPGLRALCYASHVDTVTSFFVQMQEDEPAILKMLEDINSELFKNTLKINPSTELRVNDVVFAKYEEDGAFYRAAVKDCRSNGPYEVEFIDYGNSALVGREHTYPLSPEGLSQPRLSVPCSLVDGSAYDGDSAFTEAVSGRALMVHFISRVGTQWEVTVEILEEDHAAVVTPDNAAKTQEAGAETVSPDSVGYPGDATETREEGPASARPAVTPESRSPWQPNSPRDGTLLSVSDNGHSYVRVEERSKALSPLQCSLTECLGPCRGMTEGQVRKGSRCSVQSDQTGQRRRAVVQGVARRQCQAFPVDYDTTEEVSISCLREPCDRLPLLPGLAALCERNDLGLPVDKDPDLPWTMVGKDLKMVGDDDFQMASVSRSESDAARTVDVDADGLSLTRRAGNGSSPRQRPPAEDAGSPRQPAEERGEGEADGETPIPLRPRRLSQTPVVRNRAYSAFAAAVTGPSEFHVVLDDLLRAVSAVSALLDDLVPEALPALPEALLVPGAGCLVRCQARGRWCRAQVVQAGPALVLLCLVDYGHCLDVARDDRAHIKSLPEELAALPKVTYPCSLRGVEPAGREGQWSEAALVFFQERVIRRSLRLVFRDGGAPDDHRWEVDVLTDGTHVAVEMVEAGHAVYTDVMLGLRFQEESRRKYAPPSPLAERILRKPASQIPLAERILRKPASQIPLAERILRKPASQIPLAEESPTKPASQIQLAKENPTKPASHRPLDEESHCKPAPHTLAEESSNKPAPHSPLAKECHSKPAPLDLLDEDSLDKLDPPSQLDEESPTKLARLSSLAERDYQEVVEECEEDGAWVAETEASAGEAALLNSTAGEATLLSSTAGEATLLSSTAGEAALLSSTAGEAALLSSTAGEAALLSSTAGEAALLCSTAGEATQLSSTAGEAAVLSSTAGEAALLSSTAGDTSCSVM